MLLATGIALQRRAWRCSSGTSSSWRRASGAGAATGGSARRGLPRMSAVTRRTPSARPPAGAEPHDGLRYPGAEAPFYLPPATRSRCSRRCHARGLPVMLKGPTGCGKTRFVEHMAWRLGRPLVTVACHDDLSASDLTGRYLIRGGETVWLDGPLTRAARAGAICYLDEIVEARQDTVVVIHPLTDDRRMLPLEKTGELLEAAPGFQLVVSYNPGYQHVLKDLKPSTRQRFVALEFDFPPAELEAPSRRARGRRRSARRRGAWSRSPTPAPAARPGPRRGAEHAAARGGRAADRRAASTRSACAVGAPRAADRRPGSAGGDQRPDRRQPRTLWPSPNPSLPRGCCTPPGCCAGCGARRPPASRVTALRRHAAAGSNSSLGACSPRCGRSAPRIPPRLRACSSACAPRHFPPSQSRRHFLGQWPAGSAAGHARLPTRRRRCRATGCSPWTGARGRPGHHGRAPDAATYSMRDLYCLPRPRRSMRISGPLLPRLASSLQSARREAIEESESRADRHRRTLPLPRMARQLLAATRATPLTIPHPCDTRRLARLGAGTGLVAEVAVGSLSRSRADSTVGVASRRRAAMSPTPIDDG